MTTFQLQDRTQPYGLQSNIFNPVELSILRRASELLERSLHRQTLKEPDAARDYLRCKLAGLDFEVFGVLWLDAQHQLIADEVLFRGSICSTSVHLREVVKHALRHGARSAVMYHNHPSLSAEASRADHALTENLKRALDLVEVSVADHLIVAGDGSYMSFSQRGMI
jgi:DNA repair protein RadC